MSDSGKLIELLQEAVAESRGTIVAVAELKAEHKALKDTLGRVEQELGRRIDQSIENCARDHREAMEKLDGFAPVRPVNASGSAAMPMPGAAIPNKRPSLQAVGMFVAGLLIVGAATTNFECGASSREDVPPASMQDLPAARRAPAPAATPEPVLTDEQRAAVEQWLREQTPDAIDMLTEGRQ